MLVDVVVNQFSAVVVPESQESHQVSHYNCAFIRFETMSK